MKFTIDTNVLMRAIVQDDERQSAVARSELLAAEGKVVPLTTLCELAWVLRQGYRYKSSDLAETLASILDSADIVVDRAAAEAGLRWLEHGGDFADGVIAFDGSRLGADVLLTFDRKAAEVAALQGVSTRLLR